MFKKLNKIFAKVFTIRIDGGLNISETLMVDLFLQTWEAAV